MKIGEFFVENKYITQEELNKALELQKRGDNRHIGEILVDSGVITKENMMKYVKDFINICMEDAKSWLDQEQVDALFRKEKK